MSICPLMVFCVVSTLLFVLPWSGSVIEAFPAAEVDYSVDESGVSSEESISHQQQLEEDNRMSVWPVAVARESTNQMRGGRGHHEQSKRSLGYDTCQLQTLDTKILCERCAKYTKSHTVYTMCCDNVDDKVRLWCKNFLEYEFGVNN